MSHRAADVSLLDQIHVTPEEREFGWSGNLSGIRGLSEQQARRILHFENSLRQHLETKNSEDSMDQEQRAGSRIEFENINSTIFEEPFEVIGARHCRTICTRNPLSPCILKPRASLPDYQRLASSRLNRSLRLSRSQSSSLRFRSIRRKSRQNSWSSESDEFFYLIAKEKIANSDPSYMRWETSVNDSQIEHQDSEVNLKMSKPKAGLLSLLRKVGKALVSPTPSRCIREGSQDTSCSEDTENLCYLSHEMIGSASPFPMRPPLRLNSGHPSASVDGDWIGVNRKVISQSK
ncbi:hypothetical protein PCANC_16162 [Puccinia coronata f. sp. avenae]|uniref:Uncharacterized protein n=1 Tax=Puccinia coronata f. sp. avenae TaxID=200324 RepID=A0A2N5T0X4_9BASI|nr:hypothetical protein PCANC_16162 [Puccinia coronata f. sp. avenae]